MNAFQQNNPRIEAAVFEMHGRNREGPDIVVDAAGSIQNIQVAGTTENIWRDNSGWLTCAGDNGTVQKGGSLRSDDFFRLDAWRSLFFMCWLRYPPGGANYALWSYGNPNNGSDGGFGFSGTPSERVRLQFNNGLDDEPTGPLTEIAMTDGETHLVGGYFFQHDGEMFTQTFIDGQEQGMGSIRLGNWTVQPNTGFALFSRVSNAGLPVNQMYGGMQISDLTFFRSQNDMRLFTQMRLRHTYDLGRVPLPSQGPRE